MENGTGPIIGVTFLVSDRKAIEWTPNTIAAKVVIEGSRAHIELNSNTPNLKTYQMKETPDENWKDVPNSLEIELPKDTNEMVIHVVNLAGVGGPEYKIIIKR